MPADAGLLTSRRDCHIIDQWCCFGCLPSGKPPVCWQYMTTLNIFSDRTYLLPGQAHAVMLYPYWGKDPKGETGLSLYSGRYDRYTETGQQHFRMVPLKEADVAVLPFNWENVLTNKQARSLALEFAEKATEAGKPVVVFYDTDTDEPVSIKKNSLVFRTSLRRSRRQRNEFAQPAWCDDIVQKYFNSQLPLRSKQPIATVSYCGRSAPAPPIHKRVEGLIKEQMANILHYPRTKQPYSSLLLRSRIMNVLSASRLVETNFVVRNAYFDGVLTPQGVADQGKLSLTRQEYVQNTVDSDYVLCVRGGGNFSYRFYETLCCGRIPLFIDTDCVLPFDSVINWKEYTVWVDRKDLDRVDERVAAFHDALSPQDFLDLQLRCRKLWEDWLSPQGFFANLHLHFRL